MLNHTTSNLFDNARTKLWASLQTHLATAYNIEKTLTKSVAFIDSFPFPITSVDPDSLDGYWKCRRALSDLYIDETNQLDTLIKAVRAKGYAEEEKKQLYLLILGYTDMLASVVQSLNTYRPTALLEDQELADTTEKFSRLQKLIRLTIRGIPGISLVSTL